MHICYSYIRNFYSNQMTLMQTIYMNAWWSQYHEYFFEKQELSKENPSYSKIQCLPCIWNIRSIHYHGSSNLPNTSNRNHIYTLNIAVNRISLHLTEVSGSDLEQILCRITTHYWFFFFRTKPPCSVKIIKCCMHLHKYKGKMKITSIEGERLCWVSPRHIPR